LLCRQRDEPRAKANLQLFRTSRTIVLDHNNKIGWPLSQPDLDRAAGVIWKCMLQALAASSFAISPMRIACRELMTTFEESTERRSVLRLGAPHPISQPRGRAFQSCPIDLLENGPRDH
jgi:hypothetical protein